ncbi:MAG: long-chain fatty acid--CoA ligase [Acidobacteria bacterium]|nr:long-chain fatty acid--CoA ligase [Acidobacteriota bacterium]
MVERFAAIPAVPAFVYKNRSYEYAWLVQQIVSARAAISAHNASSVFSIHGDYSPHAIGLFIALALERKTIVPITTNVENEVRSRRAAAEVQVAVTALETGLSFERISERPLEHPLLQFLAQRGHAGLVLFSSGSTGAPKAIVHDLETLIGGSSDRRTRRLTFVVFLMFDHIGGLNTLLNSLAMGATLVIPERRDPESVAALIAAHKVQVLPTSPSFLNLLLLARCHERYDLSSLKLITYGTEPMPQSLLRKLRETFRSARFLQTYGTSETGIATTASLSSESLFLKIDDPGTEWKVVDGELWIRSRSQMLGYLNEASPLAEGGWYPTGDLVEESRDGYLKIVGRLKEIINVGGQKVLPAEVENVIMDVPGVQDALVRGEPNPITGQIVVADVAADPSAAGDALVRSIRLACRDRLEKFKWPVKIHIRESIGYGSRFKKVRLGEGTSS